MLKTTKELGDTADALHKSLKDAELNETEARRCRKETFELLQEVVRLYYDLSQLEESFQ